MDNSFSTEAHLQAWLAAPEERRAASHAALIGTGQVQEDAFFTLAEIAREVRKHPTWLHKLEIQSRCGERFAGRYMYRKERVISYLKSPECQERIGQLREQRKALERAKG